MQNIHVKVRLTNLGDMEVVKRGFLDPQRVRSCEVDAIVDPLGNFEVHKVVKF